MCARDLLQGFKSKIETDSQLSEDEILVTPLIGDKQLCETTVLIPIDGVVKLVRIVAREIGVYEGLQVSQ